MNKFIPYGRQNISQQDIDAVVEVLKSDYLTQGPKVQEFEQALSSYCHADFAVATNSATSALHLACLAMGVTSGDIVWTSPVTFVASANCARYCGATVDFVDIDINTGNMSATAFARRLEDAKAMNKLPKVVIPVHLCGQSCDMKSIGYLARKYGVKVIEDASHAIGGKYLGKEIGRCEYSDITVFSFHPVKIVTSAEGGVALTNNADFANKMARLRSHGITRNTEEMTCPPDGDWYYQQVELGYNYRMTDLQAALGLSQLSRLDEFVEKRHHIAANYDSAFANLALTPLYQQPDCHSAYHLYVVKLNVHSLALKKQVFESLRKANIGINVHYIPVHLQPYYQELGFRCGDFPVAERYYEQALSLPLYPDLTIQEQRFVIEKLEELV